ncbi:MAG TPA: FAD-dependent oxidoreductase [Thermoanaerobaculia bacterium]
MPSHQATVTDIEVLAPQVLQLTVAFAGGDFRFKPGQWVNFRFPEGVSRAYTIASAPERPEAVQLCVRVGSGRGGAALQKLDAGAVVMIDGPYGDFLLPENDGRDVLFLAGDTGIAPVRSIVLDMLATKDPRGIVVLYEPDQRHILYAGDFDPLARSGQIVHMSGAIETLIERNRSAVMTSMILAVGFDEFLDRARDCLRKIGIDPGTVIAESFGPMP